MFEVLKRDDSDDEVEKPKKQTKHEQRAEDKQKREATGDVVKKRDYQSNNETRAKKDDYSGSGKRTYERHSVLGLILSTKVRKKEVLVVKVTGEATRQRFRMSWIK